MKGAQRERERGERERLLRPGADGKGMKVDKVGSEKLIASAVLVGRKQRKEGGVTSGKCQVFPGKKFLLAVKIQ